MKKLLALLLYCASAAAQTYPPVALSALGPSGQFVYVGLDGSGNLYTNGNGASGGATAVQGYTPPMAMTGQNPSGQQVYLQTDSNGNLLVNCPTCTGGGGISGNENVSFSTTPTFSITTFSSHIVLTGNISTFTLPAGADGQTKCLTFVQGGNGGYTVTPPANVFGFFYELQTAQATKHNQQCYTYFVADSAWEAQSPGVINQ